MKLLLLLKRVRENVILRGRSSASFRDAAQTLQFFWEDVDPPHPPDYNSLSSIYSFTACNQFISSMRTFLEGHPLAACAWHSIGCRWGWGWVILSWKICWQEISVDHSAGEILQIIHKYITVLYIMKNKFKKLKNRPPKIKKKNKFLKILFMW